MDALFAAALGFSLSQIILCLLLLLRNRRIWTIQESFLALFLLSVACYLLFPLFHGHWASRIILVLQTLMPGLFWLFCASLFNDDFKLKPWMITLVLATAILPLVGSLLQSADLPSPRAIFWLIPQGIEFLLMGLAFVMVVRHWRDDLVEVRRNLRSWFCGMIGVYMFAIVLMREIIFPGAAWLELWQYVPLGVICLITNLFLLQYKLDLLHPDEQPAALSEVLQMQEKVSAEEKEEATQVVDIPIAVMEKLTSLLEGEHVYREMGLTIGQLAERLDLPEYRLRKIINAGLGYRNFNYFLNGYRVREAGQRLADAKNADEAVLNIALDIGFSSLSSFNKAFREAYGQTPTEFRNTNNPAVMVAEPLQA